MNNRKQAAVDMLTAQLNQAVAFAKANRDETIEKQAVSYGYAVATMETAASVLSVIDEL